jgi:membrane protein
MRGSWRQALEVIQDAGRHFARHRCESLGSALAFKTLLAVTPLLVVAVAVLGFVVGDGEAGKAATDTARQAIGPRAGEIVQRWLTSARSFGTAATTIGIILLLWGSSRLVAQLDFALHIVFDPADAEPARPVAKAVVKKLLSRLTSIGWTLLLGAWIAASILTRLALNYLAPEHIFLGVLRTLLGFGSLTLAVAVAYKMLPSQGLRMRQALEGAAITAGLITLGTWLLELWFRTVRVGTGYGAAGGLVVFLLWLYATAQLFLFGAEVSAALHRGQSSAVTAS